MKRVIFLFTTITLLLFHSYAAPIPKKISAEISKVTVFIQGAQVSRMTKTRLSKGNTTLLFEKLSPYIDKQSLQVNLQGAATIMSVSHRINQLEILPPSERVGEIKEKMENLRLQLEQNEQIMALFAQEEKLLFANQKIEPQENSNQAAELAAMATLFRERLADLQKRRWEITTQNRQLEKEIAQLQKELDNMKVTKEKPTSEIEVIVSAENASEVEITLSYLVAHAGWIPSYDLRVKDVESPLQIDYKAHVYQQTGVEWKDVKLTISSADPWQSGTKPELQPWYIGQRPISYRQATVPFKNGQISGQILDENGIPIVGATIMVPGATIGSFTDEQGQFSLTLPAGTESVIVSYVGYQNQEVPIAGQQHLNIHMNNKGVMLDEVVVTGYGTKKLFKRNRSRMDDMREQKEAGEADYYDIPLQMTEITKPTMVEFEIALPYSIPSDGKQLTVKMKQYELKADYEYYAVPKLDPDAFLTASVTDWEQYQLLSGEANIYFEGTYTGKSILDISQLEDTLSISLGRDKQVVVSRTKIKDFTKKRFIGSNVIVKHGWAIEVRNQKKQAIHLTVKDQFPISQKSEIEIDEFKYNKAKLDETTNELTWTFDMKPSASEKVDFSYEIKHPKHYRLYAN